VALGAAHTLFLDWTGRLFSCGVSRAGQGTTTVDAMLEPCTVRPVEWKPPARVVSVEAADQLSLLLLENGCVYLCGIDRAGCWESTVPRLASSLIDEVDLVAVGGCLNMHVFCRTKEGEMFSCGANNNGQLGRGHRERDVFLWPPSAVPIEFICQ